MSTVKKGEDEFRHKEVSRAPGVSTLRGHRYLNTIGCNRAVLTFAGKVLSPVAQWTVVARVTATEDELTLVDSNPPETQAFYMVVGE